jgi:hypothetical protein
MLRGTILNGTHAPRRADFVNQDDKTITGATINFERAHLRPLIIKRLEEGFEPDPSWSNTEMYEAFMACRAQK